MIIILLHGEYCSATVDLWFVDGAIISNGPMAINISTN